jgi:DNA replication protein DnaC
MIMSQQKNLQLMQQMRLYGMYTALEGLIQSKQLSALSAEQLLALLLQQEWDERNNRKITRLTHNARFRYNASMQEIRADSKRNLSVEQLAQISTCDWVHQAESLVITGPTGVGKSHLTSAIGHHCCQMGLKVIYHNTQKLYQQLRLARLDGSHRRQMLQIAKAELLILDDFGLQRLDEMARLDLLEMVEDRHGRKATIIASQLPVSLWYEVIGEPTLADAILDRIVTNAIRIELSGESLRKRK